MPFSISPSVIITEKDMTYVVRSQTSAIGGLVGKFDWGPAEDPYFITTGEEELIRMFGKPTDTNYLSTMMGIDFLSYVDETYVVRVVGPNVRNSVRSGELPVRVLNDNEYENAVIADTEFIAKWPGVLGDNFIVDIADASKFPDWDYAQYFATAPQPGEFSIVILDRDGYFSNGLGASGQKDALTVTGIATGGVSQIEDFTFAGGPIDGGTKQQETLSFNGIATGVGPLLIAHTGATPGNVSVSMTVDDLPSDVAATAAIAFAGDANFDSAVVVNGSQVLITYSDYLLHDKIVTYSLDGISVASALTTPGTNEVVFMFDGNAVTVLDADTAAEVATKTQNVLLLDPTTYSGAVAVTEVLTVTYLIPALRPVINSISVSGVTGSSAMDTPGTAYFDYTYLSEVTQLKFGDAASVSATKIAQTILTNLAATYNEVVVSGNKIVLSRAVLGLQPVTAPLAETDGVAIATVIQNASTYGDILEKYENVTELAGDLYSDGSTRYYVEKINNESEYIRIGDSTIALAADTIEFTGGANDNTEDLDVGFELLENSEAYNFNFLMGGLQVSEQQKMVDVADTRRDIVSFISPMLSDVQATDWVTEITEWSANEVLRDSSYNFKVGNWAYMKDTYNDVWRWVPCSSGAAGLMARMYHLGYPWYSVANADYSYFLNYNKLAINPKKTQRDALVKYQINPVVAFKGDGIRLYGDWTGTQKQSAFQFSNVRNLFIEIEKAISTYAHQYLFKLNDVITRAQFLNTVRPYLRDVQSKRGMEDFKVVVDDRNNTPQRVMNGEMYADFMIKPLYSIRYIYLNFTAIRSDFSFEEVEEALF